MNKQKNTQAPESHCTGNPTLTVRPEGRSGGRAWSCYPFVASRERERPRVSGKVCGPRLILDAVRTGLSPHRAAGSLGLSHPRFLGLSRRSATAQDSATHGSKGLKRGRVAGGLFDSIASKAVSPYVGIGSRGGREGVGDR